MRQRRLPVALAAGALLVATVGAVDAAARSGSARTPPRSYADGPAPGGDTGGAPGPSAVPTTVPIATASPGTSPARSLPPTGDDMHGLVLDASGKPLAHVHLAYDVSVPDAPAYRPVAVTDDHGRFAFACLHQDYAPQTPSVYVSSFDAASGLVDPRAPDIAWTEVAQDCGPAKGRGTTIVVTPGAGLEGTLDQHGAPVHRAGLRVGVQCDTMPRGFVDAFVAQVVADVDAGTGHYRIAGLRSDHCAIGVFDHAGRNGREVVRDVEVTEGHATHEDVDDRGQDYFPGDGSPGPSASPSPSPTTTCLAICPPDVRDRS